MTRALLTAALLTIAIVAPAFADPAGGPADWRRYDANEDGCLDKADAGLLFTGGLWNPKLDVNGDGEKTTDDAFALMLLMTRWDCNADMKVDDEDFAAREPVTMPEPDVAAATSLARHLLVDATATLPAGQEDRLMQEWPTFQFLPPTEQAALLDEAGMLALVEHNLDVAQWAFARAAELDINRASALSNLGFTLCEQGRSANALTLLARARQMEPGAAPTASNIGWVFARTGQLAEAAQWYRETIALEPNVAQYQLNLGVVLLRRDDNEGARAAFGQATKLNPDDRDALMMSVATNPSPAGEMAAYKKEYEKYREETNREYEEQGMEPQQPSWDDLDTSERIEELIRQEGERAMARRNAELASLTEETKEQLRKTVEPVLPKGAKATEDWARFWGGFPGTFEALQSIIAGADLRACQIATDCQRRHAAAVLGLDSVILQMALTQAQADMAAWSDGDDARHAFEETVNELYEQPMQFWAERLRTAHDTAHLDLHPVDTDALQASVIAWMAIPIAALDPVYGDGFNADTSPRGPNIDLKMDNEPAFGLSLGIVGVEWKPDSNEFKLQAGQGIIVAGTWSPARGFGFQAGTGVSFTEGSFKVSAANYVKFGSDGSITVDYKVSGGVAGPNLGTKWGGSASTTLRAATHEPVGTW